MKKKNFKVTAVEIIVNLDFRSRYKSKNNGEKLLPRSLVMKLFEATSCFLLNEKRSYTDASIAVVNGCIACICSWMLVIYILPVGETSRSHLSVTGFAIMKKQHLSSFVLRWYRYFISMYFHEFFNKLSNKLLWLFCLFVSFFPMKLHFLVF